MDYPHGLSADQKNRIERTRDEAEIALRIRLKAEGEKAHRLNLAQDFVFAVFRTLAREIADAERQGVYSGSDGRKTLEHFVRFSLIPHAYDLSDIRHYYIGFQDFPMEQFRARLLEHLTESDLWTEYLQMRLSAWREVPGRSVTADLIVRRRALVKAYRVKQGFTVADLARHAAMSDSAIRGVIQEDRSRFNDESQKKLLRVLGVSIDEWYRLK